MKSQEERVWTVWVHDGHIVSVGKQRPNPIIDGEPLEIEKVEVCPVAERDTAREEAERLRGAIEEHRTQKLHGSLADDDFADDKLYAALQPPDGTEAMFTDAWERPE